MARTANSSPQTLLVLSQLLSDPGSWHYGYDISRRTGLKSGTLYPILARLREQQWLETRWAESESPGRPPRHTYRVTDYGAREASALLAQAERVRVALHPGSAQAGA
jgi:DNA-binding PadR family transcriptional regulator